MKMRTLRNMALYLTLATMANSANVFAHPHHSSSDGHHHEHKRRCPTASQVREFEVPFVGALDGIVGNLNTIFVAQAFSADPDPATNPNLAALIATQFGPEVGGIIQLTAVLRNVLLQLGAHPDAVANVVSQTVAVSLLAVDYSTIIATGVGDSLAAFNAWQAAGAQLALYYSQLAHFSPQEVLRISNAIRDLIINQSQVIQGYNLVPPLNLFTAVVDDSEAHRNARELGNVVIKQLLHQRCR